MTLSVMTFQTLGLLIFIFKIRGTETTRKVNKYIEVKKIDLFII